MRKGEREDGREGGRTERTKDESGRKEGIEVGNVKRDG